jgi:hypothetical protein
MRASFWPMVVLLVLPVHANAQGLLERIRLGSSSGSGLPNPKLVVDDSSPSSNTTLDDQSYLELIGAGLLGLTSPFWLPPLIVHDSFDQLGYFSA